MHRFSSANKPSESLVLSFPFLPDHRLTFCYLKRGATMNLCILHCPVKITILFNLHHNSKHCTLKIVATC